MFVKMRILYNFDPVIYLSSIKSVFNLSPSSAILYQKLNFNDRLSVPRPCQPVPAVWVQEAGANNTIQCSMKTKTNTNLILFAEPLPLSLDLPHWSETSESNFAAVKFHFSLD